MIDRTMDPHRETPLSQRVWPRIGLGTWRMGELASNRAIELAAIRAAIGTGYRLIDSAEMYGEGGAERVVGDALREVLSAGRVRREDLFIISKVYPHHATRDGVVEACHRSLERLGLDHLDAYLLHWPGTVPLADTVAGFEMLRSAGSIRAWGVSNFDVAELDALFAIDGGDRCAMNQVYFSLGARGPEFDLLPWHRRNGIMTMAYSPLDQGALVRAPVLRAIATKHRCDPAQVALAWLIRQDGVAAIAKTVSSARLRLNLSAGEALSLDAADLATLDTAFPPPRRKRPLAVL